MDEHPIQVLIRCNKPSIVAAQVFEQDSVVEAKIHSDGHGLLISTRNPDRFYSLLNRIVLDNNIEVEAVTPAKTTPSIRSYQYLIGPSRRHQLMVWNLWSRQIDAIVRLEPEALYLLYSRRSLAIPYDAGTCAHRAALDALDVCQESRQCRRSLNIVYAGIFQGFHSALRDFLLVHGDVLPDVPVARYLEKTLHYYLLAPVRREVLAIGQYTAGLVASCFLFGICTIATYILLYLRPPEAMDFLVHGAGIPYLARYVIVADAGMSRLRSGVSRLWGLYLQRI